VPLANAIGLASATSGTRLSSHKAAQRRGIFMGLSAIAARGGVSANAPFFCYGGLKRLVA